MIRCFIAIGRPGSKARGEVDFCMHGGVSQALDDETGLAYSPIIIILWVNDQCNHPKHSITQLMRRGWVPVSLNQIFSHSTQCVAKASIVVTMARSQNTAHRLIQRRDANTEQEQHANSLMTEKRLWKGIMNGQNLDILLASALLTLPMLILGIALMSMVYIYQMPDHNSTYSTGNRTGIALGSPYYVNISSLMSRPSPPQFRCC